MGQLIEITTTTVDGDVAAFHTDRSITGQDGVAFDSAEVAAAADSFPGSLAARMFEADDAIDHVFVASNQVVARRPGGWGDGAADAAGDIITAFFVFYADSVS